MGNTEYFLYVGAFTKQADSLGIKAYHYDAINNSVTAIGAYGRYPSMSCMVIDGDLLFANVESVAEDLIFSFRIQPDGSLVELDSINIGGCLIAHVSIDREDKLIFASCMGASKVVMISYDKDGKLFVADQVEFDDPGSFTLGCSTNPRQASSKIHSSFLMPNGKYVNICNLGADKLYTVELDKKNGKFVKHPELTISFAGCTGPRHMLFNKAGNRAYLNTELSNEIFVYEVNEDSSLKELQRVSTLDPKVVDVPKSETSVIIMDQNEKYLLCGNRGQDNIVKYEIDENGLLKIGGFFDCYGEMPRGLTFGYTDGVVFSSNYKTGNVAVIHFNKLTGDLGYCIQKLEGIAGAANTLWTGYEQE